MNSRCPKQKSTGQHSVVLATAPGAPPFCVEPRLPPAPVGTAVVLLVLSFWRSNSHRPVIFKLCCWSWIYSLFCHPVNFALSILFVSCSLSILISRVFGTISVMADLGDLLRIFQLRLFCFTDIQCRHCRFRHRRCQRWHSIVSHPQCCDLRSCKCRSRSPQHFQECHSLLLDAETSWQCPPIR